MENIYNEMVLEIKNMPQEEASDFLKSQFKLFEDRNKPTEKQKKSLRIVLTVYTIAVILLVIATMFI